MKGPEIAQHLKEMLKAADEAHAAKKELVELRTERTKLAQEVKIGRDEANHLFDMYDHLLALEAGLIIALKHSFEHPEALSEVQKTLADMRAIEDKLIAGK